MEVTLLTGLSDAATGRWGTLDIRLTCSLRGLILARRARLLMSMRCFRQGGSMRRREFIMLSGGTVATWPFGAHAQKPAGRVYRIGYLSIITGEHSYAVKAFEEGLRRLGYRVGENVVIEYRFADGEIERL